MNYLDVTYRYPTRFVVVEGIRLAYVDVNEFGGDPVVFLHDVAGDLDAFAQAYERIGRTRRAVGFDFPGFGKSDRPPIDDAVVFHTGVLEGFLSAVDIDRASLVGHGLGAAVAARFASEHPARVERLVLSAVPAVEPRSDDEMATFMERWRADALLAHDRTSRRAWFQALAAGWNDLLESELAVRNGLAESVGFRAWTRTVEDAMESVLHHPVGHRLGRITAPTLVIWGADDPVAPPADASRVRDAIGRARVVPLEPCGHLPMFEQPDEFVDAIDGFLAHAASGALDAGVAVRVATDIEPWMGLAPGIGRIARMLFEQRDALTTITDGLTLDDVVWRPSEGAAPIAALLMRAGAVSLRAQFEVLEGGEIPDDARLRFGIGATESAPRKSPARLISEIAWAHGHLEAWLRDRTDADLNRGYVRKGGAEAVTLRWVLWKLVEETASIRGQVEYVRALLEAAR